MDKTALVNEDISEGKKLIQHLDNTAFKANSALWFYATDLNEWRLVLASEYLETHGLKEAYSFVQKELEKLGLANIALNNIAIIGANDELIELLKRGGLAVGGISEIRFTRNVINGVMIEDALIYRLA
jgi:hypothetical protein